MPHRSSQSWLSRGKTRKLGRVLLDEHLSPDPPGRSMRATWISVELVPAALDD
jgi:hypothetical protein